MSVQNAVPELANTGQLAYDDPRTATGWWSTITGGDVEKQASVAQSDYLNEWNANQAEIARQFESDQARIARQFSSNEAQRQRNYETEMSNTAYTRAMRDMKNAGLNPALMYAKGGMEASTPSGAAAQTSKANSASAAKGELPYYTNAQTGQLAAIIGSIAFASANAMASAGKLSLAKETLEAKKAADLAKIPSWVKHPSQWR